MFRDLKEYQEIAKIYAEKVSKPEDLDERVRGGGMSGAIKPFDKPLTNLLPNFFAAAGLYVFTISLGSP